MILQLVSQMATKMKSCFLPTVDSIYFSRQIARRRVKLRNGSVSGSPVLTKHYLTYLYAVIMSIRYLTSGIALYAGYDRQYFTVDIVMYAIKKRGNFDKITFLFCSILLIFCCTLHYIRNYCTDYLFVSEQNRYSGQSMEQFWAHYPQFRVDLNSRNIPKIWAQLWSKVWRLSREVNSLKVIGSENQERVTNLAKLVKFNLTIEIINLWLFVLFSK